MLYDGRQFYRSWTYSIASVVKIGGGDAFCAGLIYALLHKKSLPDALEFAAAACAKHTVEGDILCASVSDIEWIMGSDGTGRMTR
ncbi:MAG: hypothetical protein GX111_00370 [Clostridiales bacterium]|jgi:2-dehydro-3-deoxygluconokinase|nr:hypothetical protein [Clostridiales bacterium]